MSAQDVFCFDEDSFPSLLDRKPSAARRARGVSERKGAAPPSTIVKSFVDTGLGRRRRAKLLSECEDDLACDVPYSLHRKNRWAECNPPALLGDGGEEVAIAVVERNAAKKGTRLVNAVHYVDREGTRRSNLAKGKGTDQENLLTEVREQERPVLLYSLCKTPTAEKAALSPTKPLQKKTSRRAGAFNMDSEEAYVPSESEEVVVEEMPVWRRSREPSFCLGDYIVSKEYVCPPASCSGGKSERSREASPVDMSAYVEVAPEESSAPSALLVAKGTYKTIEIAAGKWSRGAHEQMRALTTSAYYTRWLDANERRLMVDLSTAVCSHCAGRFLLVVVFEKMNNSKNIKMTINCVDDLDLSSLPSADSLDDLLFNTVALAVEKFNDGRPPVEHAAKVNPAMESTGSLVDRDTVLAEHRELSITATSDEFDRILDSDDEDDIVSGQRCNKCGESRADDLFEMEEDWLCRGCLTQTICAILGNRMIVKLNVPVACHPDSTPLDALPLFVPVVVLNKYMRCLSMAIAEILKGDDLIVECKLCMNLVRLKDGFEASVLACPGCKGVSCLSCGCPPHEPMSCEEYSQWSAKFDATIESLRIDANYKFARAITCECGEDMMLPQEQKEVTCPRCHIAFDAVSLVKKRGGGAVQARVARLVPLPPRAIAKEFAAVAAVAHAERVDDRRRAIFERAARKMRSASGSSFDAECALALRATALHAAEMHAASAYLARARAPRAASIILAAWEQLRTAVQEEKEEKRAARALEGLKEVLKEAGIV